MSGSFLIPGLRSNRSSRSALDLAATPGPRTAPNAQGASLTTRSDGRPNYPTALPSVLSSKFDGPVTGTAIIDHDYTAITALVEMVTPDASPLMEPLTVEYLHHCTAQMDEACQSELARGSHQGREDDDNDTDSLAGSESSSVERKRQEAANTDPAAYEAALARRRQEREELRGSFFSSGNADSVPTSTNDLTNQSGSFTRRTFGGLIKRRSRAALEALGVPSHSRSHGSLPTSGSFSGQAEDSKKRRERRSHRVLKEGGYVLFADEYLHNHPTSPVAEISQEFQLANPVTEAPAPPDPKLDERKRKVEDIKRLIREAETQKRPLFRRRPAELVYGEARYVPRPTKNVDDDSSAQTERDSQHQREEDADVYLASSFDSASSAQHHPSNSQAATAHPKPADIIEQVGQTNTGSSTRRTERQDSAGTRLHAGGNSVEERL